MWSQTLWPLVSDAGGISNYAKTQMEHKPSRYIPASKWDTSNPSKHTQVGHCNPSKHTEVGQVHGLHEPRSSKTWFYQLGLSALSSALLFMSGVPCLTVQPQMSRMELRCTMPSSKHKCKCDQWKTCCARILSGSCKDLT